MLSALLGNPTYALDGGGYPPADHDYWYEPLVAGGGPHHHAVSPEAAFQLATVYACVNVRAETLGSLPCLTYRRLNRQGEKELATDSPEFEVFHTAVADGMTATEFFEMGSRDSDLWGDAISRRIPGPRSGVGGLERLDPREIDITRLDNGMRRYENKKTRQRWLENEVMHLRMNSFDGVRGQGAVQLHARSIGIHSAMFQHLADSLENAGAPGGFVSTEGKMSDAAFQRNKKSWNEAHARHGRRYGTAFFDQSAKYNQVGTSNRDMQLEQIIKADARLICRIFRVQPHMVMDLEDATYSNIEMQSLEFVIYTVLPLANRWEKVIQTGALSDPELFVEFQLNGLLRGNIQSRYNAYAIGIQWGFLTANEVRRLENLNPVEGGDVRLTPLNMSPSALAILGDDAPPLLRAAVEQRIAEGQRNRGAEGQRDGGEVDQKTSAPLPLCHFAPLIEDAAERIASVEQKQLAAKADKFRDRQDRLQSVFAEWFAGGHAEFACRVVRPIAAAVEQATGQPLAAEPIAAQIIAAGQTLVAAGAPMETIENWQATRQAAIETIITQHLPSPKS